MGIYYDNMVLGVRYCVRGAEGEPWSVVQTFMGPDAQHHAHECEPLLSNGRYKKEELYNASSTYGPGQWQEWLFMRCFDVVDGNQCEVDTEME